MAERKQVNKMCLKEVWCRILFCCYGDIHKQRACLFEDMLAWSKARCHGILILLAENMINWCSNKGIRPTQEVHCQDNISQLTHFLKTQGKNFFFFFTCFLYGLINILYNLFHRDSDIMCSTILMVNINDLGFCLF